MTNTEGKPASANGRFTVSESGMRELNSSREPWDLVKELIQNAWDEAPFATECRVAVEPQPESGATMVTVQDDGPGFADIADAFTLMGHTSKRSKPDKRGRFNIGEKDVISVAIEAEVETVGSTVFFPRTGSREVKANSRRKGTVVKVLMPWNELQSSGLVAKLRCFRPPVNCRLFINDLEVPPRPAKALRSVSLPTVAQNGPNEPMRTTQRRTETHFVEPADPSGERWIYEMGIPVRSISCPWDIDVMQKIPMSQQRNTISEAYLNRIYAEALNENHKKLERDELSSQWVKRAVEHQDTNPQAAKSALLGRYGSEVVLATLDQEANRRAAEAGYSVLDPGALSSKERDLLQKHVGVKGSDEVFPTPPPPHSDYEPEPGSNEELFAEWVVKMAGHCHLAATVRYFHEPSSDRLADCSVSTASPVLRFNTARLGEKFFQPPYEAFEHWDILLHELGHALSNRPLHGEAWGEGVSKAGALIAVRMIREERNSKAITSDNSSSRE